MRKFTHLALILALAAVRVNAQPAAPTTPAAPAATPAAPAATPVAPAENQTVAPTDNQPANPDEVSIKETEAPKLIVTQGTKDTLSVDFPNEDIRTILRNVADLFELNLVIPDTLQGKASIKLRDVTWRQIFQVVLAPAGYTFVEDNNIIKVVSLDSLQQEPVTTEVFILNYAKAADLQPSIAPMIDATAGGKIQVDTRANALIITERPTRIKRISAILTDLDKPTSQVLIESKFFETDENNTKNLGVNWASLAAYHVNAGSLQTTYNQGSGETTTNGTTGTNINVPYMQRGIAAANQVPAAGVINSIGTVTPPTTTYTEFPWLVPNPANASLQSSYFPTTTPGSVTGIGPASLDTQTLTNTLSHATTAVFSADQFSLILSALESDSNTKLVSDPTVVTLNNVDAFINVGTEYPIPDYQYNTQTGSFEVSGFTYKDIGIILRVTPQVNVDGFIKLTLQPEVSSISGTVNFGGASGATIPIISTRKAITQVTLKDGSTLGIGGLLQSNVVKGKTKVPLLGDIPILGRLFTSNNDTGSGEELVIFITAKTIDPQGGSVSDVFDPRLVRQIGVHKDELPGYRDGSDPFAPPAPSAR
jgi:type IV pilus assembly protein PilQ